MTLYIQFAESALQAVADHEPLLWSVWEYAAGVMVVVLVVAGWESRKGTR